MEIAKLSSVAAISLLAAMSPGPDFAVVTRNCLSGTFRVGLMTTVGITCALLVHVTYCVLGIGLVIAETPWLFQVLKYVGAAYLFYLGLVLLKEKTSPEGNSEHANEYKKKSKPFLSGFLCNLLNPKATLFILTLFTQFIDPGMNIPEKLAVAGTFIGISFAWFVLISFLITHRLLQKHFARFQFVITKVMGIVLCLLALYVAFLS